MQCTGNLGCFPWGKRAAIVWRYPGFFLLFSMFSCFRNQPKSDMDYRIFNVHAWSFLCVHIYIHTGVGHTNESAQHFHLEKLTIFWVCSGRGWKLWSLDLESMVYQFSHYVILSILVRPVYGLLWSKLVMLFWLGCIRHLLAAEERESIVWRHVLMMRINYVFRLDAKSVLGKRHWPDCVCVSCMNCLRDHNSN